MSQQADYFACARNDGARKAGCYAAFACTVSQNSARRSASRSVAGLASLVSYPALLAVGLPPVTANVSNTVALVFSSAGKARMGLVPALLEVVRQLRGGQRSCGR